MSLCVKLVSTTRRNTGRVQGTVIRTGTIMLLLYMRNMAYMRVAAGKKKASKAAEAAVLEFEQHSKTSSRGSRRDRRSARKAMESRGQSRQQRRRNRQRREREERGDGIRRGRGGLDSSDVGTPKMGARMRRHEP